MRALMYIDIFDDGPVGARSLEGPYPDPNLVILEEELRRLSREYGGQVAIRRYNLGTDPKNYTDHPAVAALMRERGPAVLPVTLIDGRVVKTGAYPGYREIEPDEAGADTGDLRDWRTRLGNRG